MQEENLGTIKISDDVITACAAAAASGIPGVSRLAAGFTENLSINILGIEPGGMGVRLSREEEGLVLDIYVIVEYRVKIPQLAWEIQSNVKKEVEGITDIKVKEVNIHVQGVDLPGEEENR